jgi:hypothetical protein
MVWVRVDDLMPEHPKLATAGALGLALDVAGICYASRHLTDGFIAEGAVGQLVSLKGITLEGADDDDVMARLVARLVDTGRWERDDERGGWWVHDYLDYNPSAADVQERRAEDRRRKASIRERKRGVTEPSAGGLGEGTASEGNPNGSRTESAESPVGVGEESALSRTRSRSPKTSPRKQTVTEQAEAGLGVADDDEEDASLKLKGRTANAADRLAEHDLQRRIQSLGPPDNAEAYRNECRKERVRRNGRRLIELTEAEPGMLAGRLAERILEEEAERDEQQRVARPDPYRPPDFKPEGVGKGVPMPPDVRAHVDKVLGRHRVDDKLAEGEP